jgi:nicotinamidase-related amidase
VRGTGPSAGRSSRGRAILLLDLVHDRLHPDGACPVSAPAALRRFVQGELDYFRERGRPVIHVSTRSNRAGPGGAAAAPDRSPAAGGEFDEQFAPRADELVIDKPRASAFDGTDLAARLAELDVGQVTLVGVETHGSVLATLIDAVGLGYQVVVPDTCVASSQPELHQAALKLVHEARKRRSGAEPPGPAR